MQVIRYIITNEISSDEVWYYNEELKNWNRNSPFLYDSTRDARTAIHKYDLDGNVKITLIDIWL